MFVEVPQAQVSREFLTEESNKNTKAICGKMINPLYQQERF